VVCAQEAFIMVAQSAPAVFAQQAFIAVAPIAAEPTCAAAWLWV
jgi:hypothetical protein